MKAVAFETAGSPLRLVDLPVPEASPGSLTIKVHACGICGSDLHAAQTPGLLGTDAVMGHEFAGEVVSVGTEVSGNWRVGDRVVPLPLRGCGNCAACRERRYAACEMPATQGFRLDAPGAYAEYTTCQAAMALKIPDGIGYDEAALVEPFAVAPNAYRSGRVPMGGGVLIIGAGVIGLAVAARARFFGAGDIAISDVVPERLTRAKAAGADIAIDASTVDNPVAEFHRQTGRMPAVIFECVGRSLLQQIIGMAPPKAHLVIAGANLEPEKISVIASTIKRLRISFVFTYERGDFELTLRTLAKHRIDVAPFISGRIHLDDVPEMFETLKRPNTHCKVLIHTQG